jgi:aerobic-type carbon monoxide dehydrogenase small subunit (CoxS/CutS family)
MEWPTVGLTLRVDGHEYPVPQVWIGDSLLAVLRERLDLDEPRDGCGIGECGACLVTLDGTPAASCLVPAVAVLERDVRTPRDPSFDAARAAVAAAGASPCGFCAPALAIAITGLLRRNLDPGPAAVREALSGIVCRCSESGHWIEAVALAKEAEDVAAGGPVSADPDDLDLVDPADPRLIHPDRAPAPYPEAAAP